MTVFSYPTRWIDAHAHIFSDDDQLVQLLQRSHVKANLVCVGFKDGPSLEYQHSMASDLSARLPDYYGWTAGWPWPDLETGDYASTAASTLTAAFEHGAVAVKVWKNIGLEARRPDGTWLQIDHPIFQPLCDLLARYEIPLLAHLAEPLAAWLPLRSDDPNFEYYSTHPEWHLYTWRDVPSHAEIM